LLLFNFSSQIEQLITLDAEAISFIIMLFEGWYSNESKKEFNFSGLSIYIII
jgi:hypothetical protein